MTQFILDAEPPPAIRRILAASTIEGHSADAWLADDGIALVRKACLLNILAALCATPSPTSPLSDAVDSVFAGEAERIYVTMRSTVRHTLDALVAEPSFPFYLDLGQPLPMHRAILSSAAAHGLQDATLRSYRAEGSPSLQIVLADSPFEHTVADIDLDLYCPDQDVVSLISHTIEEVLPGEIHSEVTDHLAMRAILAKGPAAPFLCYTLEGESRD